MSEISKVLGQRIRSYRIKNGLSQEKLAEFSGCHPTYIGQLERGEKNATLESIARIAKALGISLSTLFDKLDGYGSGKKDIPLECFELIASKSLKEQEIIFKLLVEMDEYKNI